MEQELTIPISTPGQLLSAYRRRAGVTQQSLADAVGVTPGSIQNYEADRHHPSAEVWTAMACALEIPDAIALAVWK